jgi:hypothetical protein
LFLLFLSCYTALYPICWPSAGFILLLLSELSIETYVPLQITLFEVVYYLVRHERTERDDDVLIRMDVISNVYRLRISEMHSILLFDVLSNFAFGVVNALTWPCGFTVGTTLASYCHIDLSLYQRRGGISFTSTTLTNVTLLLRT